LIRESRAASPKITARYEFGVEKSISLEGADEAGVEKALDQLVQKKN